MNIKKIMYMIVGLIGLGLGAIGAVLPLMPAFPFLLLAAVCFGKSNEKLDNWFKGTKLYKDNLETFVKGEGMTKKAKCRVLGLISGLMAFGFLMMGAVPVGRVILVFVWIFHMWFFIYKIQTREEIQMENSYIDIESV